jgi:predicted metallopeptidase
MKPVTPSHSPLTKPKYPARTVHSLFPEFAAQQGDEKRSRFTARAGKVHTDTINLTDGLRDAADAICAMMPELHHVDLNYVHFALFYSRRAKRILTFARCYPLPGGVRQRGRTLYRLTPTITPSGKRAKYILAFAWERFWSMPPRERLETLVHELFHISAQFDGELRRFGNRVHGRGNEWFDNIIHALCELHLPAGMEFEYPALALNLTPGLEVEFTKLELPKWVPTDS